ncbi:histidyl-tRNA synthetase [Candidatus Nitrosopumilus koreensis AR1]|uniref:Histidine--tRNA ligase n=1 Tax=Candidatus Nitrosopumilus koreensis AR1 TaxID=1229908 RepID=K0B6K6_9ARCH|nr:MULTISPECIES: histidine--tRNA ligase [Nitrosopumilus]AFS80121.1 histidyl-tRNA synthetase [Candidatus Nitrosopumilus koreensis AR1]
MDLPRGMKDFEAIENSNIEHIRNHFKKLSNLYGFSFMEPSVLESLSTLETKSGPAIRDEIYYFKDKGDREVALRFDFTMGLTRYATAQKSIKLPAKFSAFGGVFRYDEPQKGRYRYFHQWDVEIYGKKTLESEAEIIELTSRLFDSLLLKDIVIDINHRNLVESYINKIFETTDSEKIADILRAIDKIAKKSKDEILTEFTKKGYDTAKLEKIIEFSQIKGTIAEVEKIFDTEQLESWNELKQLFESLENRGVSNVRINFGIVRGLDYYSGIVFEVFDKNSKLGALAGGGRYDTLTKAFGRDDIGATGVAGGVERIILTMQEQKIIPEVSQNRIAVVYINEDMQKVAHSITSLLRLNNIPADIDLAGRNIKKQMDNAGNARYSIIVGPQELENGNVVLHDMRDGKEGTISLEKLTEDPNSVLSLEKP